MTKTEAATPEPRSAALTLVTAGFRPPAPAGRSLGAADRIRLFQTALNAESAAMSLPVSRADRKRALTVLPGGAQ